ncbi:DICT sensory domain-containing protein [Nocardioides mesophilus]|uniref:MerR family transcriptional regulator n=1 Tax=Nocardioides mesophilus TaxID=433659 RepID=A0A7G9R6U8_9ACTN|nr:DICT sensory domain-containing protein [Nocardioides mesophilus]QNN51323.1 MerR family transcriptional regulator [Nocardioides mesophilus]
MTTTRAETQEEGPAHLTIGDLARRTGLTPAVIRMWETRHGFPEPHRLESGHRRYAESDVELVQHVLRRRDAGIRLEVAIAEAAASQAPGSPSVFAQLRRRHPHLATHRLKKSTLLALSWAIEDECCARAERATIFGAFQKERYYRPAAARWEELARVARSAMALGDFTTPSAPGERVIRVQLPEDAPMRREWAVVCDAPDLPAVLTAWELPGQTTVPDRHRIFESVWSIDPRAVRDASRVCAQVAQSAGVAEAGPLLYELAEDPAPSRTDPAAATTLFNRVVAYVDGLG